MRRLIPLALVLAAACGGATRSPKTTPAPAPAGAIQSAVANPQRPEANRARDGQRHPTETLAFFGLKPEMTVVELWPGTGWYTEILASVVRGKGKLIVATPDPKSKNEYRAKGATAFRTRIATETAWFGEVGVATLEPGTPITLAPPNSVDLVVTFRNTHGWINDGVAADVYAAAFRALKPGGVFGVEQHRGDPGADVKKASKTGYVSEAEVIRIAEAAGFKLDAKSEVNANPRDDHDHPDGVWSLPPTLRGGDKNRDAFVAIGESDRMTLRFVKPAA
jgi:predicted methyltransferase